MAATGLAPLSTTHLKGLVNSIPDVEILRIIKSRQAQATPSARPDEATDTYVARMAEDQAEVLRQTAPAHLIVEEDLALTLGVPEAVVQEAPEPVTWKAIGGITPRTIGIKVVGDGDRPLANAIVTLTGEGYPVRGRTDESGEVSLDLYAIADDRPRSLFVAAENNHWCRFVAEPELSDSTVNTVRLQSLEESIRDFPELFHHAWGARLMGLDRIDPRLTGRGVKIAIIDTGVDNSHPLLRHIQKGVDLTRDEDADTWKKDSIGHGTHCAGTIAARNENGSSLHGFAPEAEIHVIKVFPGGRLSDLLDALDLCIQRGIDVVNISFGCNRPSWAVEQKLEECVLNGIACIVAAGNGGGPVQYPASSPWTLAVTAVGKLDEVPADTWERSTVLPTYVAADGVFSPSFTCFGPEVAVCAPGVGVISTAPGGTFDPQSGTSIATPHITGMAALLIAHHPWLVQLGGRSYARVMALFSLIQSMCTPYRFSPGRTGAGLPKLDPLQQFLTSFSQPRIGWGMQANMPQSMVDPAFRPRTG